MPDYRSKTLEVFDDLTPLLKKVAEHLLHTPVTFAQEPASKASKIINVSETTVIRFCTAIGYSGYSDLQKDIRRDLYASAALTTTNDLTATNPLQDYMQREMKKLQATIENIRPEDLDTAVSRIISADRVLISGSFNSFSMAHWLWYNLGLSLQTVHLFRMGTDNITQQLNQLTENSVLITCSFYRYALDSIWLAEEAQNKGVLSVSVTDSPIAPVVKHSDLSFLVESYAKDTFETSPSAAYGVLNAIVTGVAASAGLQEEDTELEYRLKKFFI